MDDAEREEWLKCPNKNVPENLLPLMKASFLCYSQSYRNELMELLAKRTAKAIARNEPSDKSLSKAIENFIYLAKTNPNDNFLFILVFATHGYSVNGYQEVLSPHYDEGSNTY